MALKEFKKDREYLDANYEVLKAEHKDEFVVIHNKKVISCGTELDSVLSEARNQIGKNLNHSVVEYLSSRKTEMVV
jgi:hypothetical protein